MDWQGRSEFDYTGPQSGWVRHAGDTAIPVSRWTPIDVSDWLVHIGMPELAPTYKGMEVDGPTLLNITPEDLERLNLDAWFSHTHPQFDAVQKPLLAMALIVIELLRLNVCSRRCIELLLTTCAQPKQKRTGVRRIDAAGRAAIHPRCRKAVLFRQLSCTRKRLATTLTCSMWRRAS